MLGSQRSHGPNFAKDLGRMRGVFGGEVTSGMHLGDFASKQYFPTGTGSLRLTVTSSRRPGSSAGAVSDRAITLRLETKRDGRIRKVWEIPIDRFALVDPITFLDVKTKQPVPVPKRMLAHGSFLRVLWCSGYKVHGFVDKGIEATLTARSGYAGYSVVLKNGFSFGYWYFDDRGEFQSTKTVSMHGIAGPFRERSSGFPQFGFPYPISNEEVEDTRK